MGQKFKNAIPYLIVGLVGFIAGLLASPHFWRDQPSGDAGAVGALLGPLMGQDLGNAIGDAMQQSFELAITDGGCISEEGRERLVMLPRPARDNETEVRRFLDAINSLTEEQMCQSGNDPQVDALVGLGSQNAALMLEYLNRKIGHYVEAAFKRFNDNATKGVVLSRLAAQPDLIEIVVDNGWEKDAADVIIRQLPYFVRDAMLQDKWWNAAVSAARPQHYPVLIEAFLQMDPQLFWNFEKAYAGLLGLPLFPIDELNLRWWEFRGTPEIKTRLDATVAKYGAQSGSLDALAAIATTMLAGISVEEQATASEKTPEKLDEKRKEIQTDLEAALLASGAPGETPTQMAEWVIANRNTLAFDADSRKFISR